jgi:hypothetical protein
MKTREDVQLDDAECGDGTLTILWGIFLKPRQLEALGRQITGSADRPLDDFKPVLCH